MHSVLSLNPIARRKVNPTSGFPLSPLLGRKKMPAGLQSQAGQGVACLPGKSTLGRANVDGNLTCSVTKKTVGVLPLVSTSISLS